MTERTKFFILLFILALSLALLWYLNHGITSVFTR